MHWYREARHQNADGEQDIPYLSTIMNEIEAEIAERSDLESMIVKKREKMEEKPSSGH